MIALQTAHSEDGISKALRDVVCGFAMWELWCVLGWNDIRQRYRRLLLGPLWLTLSMGVMIGTIGLVYAKLFHLPAFEYLPFVALGVTVWALISGIVMESCQVFTGSEGIIRQLSVPYSAHIFRMLWRNVIVFAHNLLIYVAVMALFDIRPRAALLLAIPGFLLICINGLWIGMLLGALNARFRDLQPIIASVMQIFFYVTPIVWRQEQLAEFPAVAQLNPLHHFVELLRMPLLGLVPSATSCIVALVITVIGYVVALLFLARFRGRIAYWV